MLREKALAVFGNRLRVRVCGVLVQQGQLLLVRHRALLQEGYFWTVPGGGVDFGESLERALRREFTEETGLSVEVKRFLFVCEFLHPPLHAVEFFFEVSPTSGQLQLGNDPEMYEHGQLIEKLAFLSSEEIRRIPSDELHFIFKRCQRIEDLLTLRGFYTEKIS